MAQILLFTNNELMFASCCWFTMKWQMLFEDTLSPWVLVFWCESVGQGVCRKARGRSGKYLGLMAW